MRNRYLENLRRREKRQTPTQRVWVTAYSVRQVYGGPEEGGWYFYKYSPVETVYCRRKDSEEIVKALQEQHPPYLPGGYLTSVLGGYDIEVAVETVYQSNATRHFPRYE